MVHLIKEYSALIGDGVPTEFRVFDCRISNRDIQTQKADLRRHISQKIITSIMSELHDHHHHHHHHQHGEECQHDHAHDHKHSFSQRAVEWDKNPEHISASSEAFKAISERIPLSKSMKVIEIGCGTGLLSALVAPHVSSLLGLDTASGMVDVFNTKVGPEKIPNMIAKEVLLDDPDHPVLEGQKFDLALSHLALHHIENVPEFLTVMKGVLVPGGRVAFTDFEDNGANAVRFHDPAVAVAHGVQRHGILVDEISRQLSDSGFKNVRVERYWSMTKPLKHEDGKMAEFPFIIIMGEN
ncbi:hypothetical protein HDU97_005220 [Phlyctochytrium planicorne]|nr:hypothetical protein HDU97_005220 [Phlyctochytrium planicorne]